MKTKTKAAQVKETSALPQYVELLNELYRSYDFFNQKFANGALPRPVITVANPHKQNVWGWFANGAWESSKESIHEIRLNPNRYKVDGVEGVLETLLHEMAHLKNREEGKKDCTSQQRHNKLFKESAETFGLEVSKAGRLGFANTKLGGAAEKVIQQLKPNTKLYNLFLKVQEEDKGPKTPVKTTSVSVDKDTKKLIDEGLELDDSVETTKDFLDNAVKFYTAYLKGEFQVVGEVNIQ